MKKYILQELETFSFRQSQPLFNYYYNILCNTFYNINLFRVKHKTINNNECPLYPGIAEDF